LGWDGAGSRGPALLILAVVGNVPTNFNFNARPSDPSNGTILFQC